MYQRRKIGKGKLKNIWNVVYTAITHQLTLSLDRLTVSKLFASLMRLINVTDEISIFIKTAQLKTPQGNRAM